MAQRAIPKEIEEKMQKAKDMKPEDMLFTYKGVLYPSLLCKPENFKAMERFEAIEDDILLVAYPKCGFNWMSHVLKKISDAAHGKRGETAQFTLLEFADPEKLQNLSKLPSQRIMGTHVQPKDIPASFFEKKTKVLVIFRNPKDTAVSYFHFYNKNPALPAFDSWDKFFSQYMSGEVMLGSYFDHAVAWEKHIDSDTVKIITYEDMIENLTEGIQQVARFFSLTLSDEQVQAIAQESTFEAMKNKSKETHGQMGNVIFRKGGVGDWKNHFSEEQSKELDTKFEQCLAGTKLGAKLKYEVHCK
ncbi:sulfotransferase 6B1-like [Acipenser oxyrinchus oxyrinchus]|uniref:Sulfotransferase n=1 Tax=Acipenser oxyrinchus oxyrinchus TaxID=40147 RepID=A0AAD8GA51_ACIOX|nr:sulfotransferase 6B1-like [Acipenser oxyrinchus oxyrinchus]